MMIKSSFFLVMLLCAINIQAVDNKVIMSNILHASSQKAARQEYSKAFRAALDRQESKEYLAWLTRMYLKTCNDIKQKEKDKAVQVMARGLRRMFGN